MAGRARPRCGIMAQGGRETRGTGEDHGVCGHVARGDGRGEGTLGAVRPLVCVLSISTWKLCTTPMTSPRSSSNQAIEQSSNQGNQGNHTWKLCSAPPVARFSSVRVSATTP
eukprot:2960097-Prymnesium_polylepis.1